MKRFAAFGLAGALLLGIAGCSQPAPESNPTPTPTVTVTVTPSPEPSLESVEPSPSEQKSPRSATRELTESQKDTIFLGVVRKYYPQYADTDKDLLEIAHLTCQKLNEGVTGAQIRGTIDPNASNSGYLAFIIGAAVETHCPQYSDEIAGKR